MRRGTQPGGAEASRSLAGKGYDYDVCNEEVLLTRLSVNDGRMVLPDGMSYRILVLPKLSTMTPSLLRKIRQLVEDGATVVGPRPLRSPSLQETNFKDRSGGFCEQGRGGYGTRSRCSGARPGIDGTAGRGWK